MFDRAARTLFDEAAAYDEARPGYPSDLIDQLMEDARLSPHARVLEIGCGTGQLTRSLAERGLEIVAVELGEQLARIAAHNLAAYPRVRVIHSSFESWANAGACFDAVACAQALHWIDPEQGFPKIHRCLKRGGHLAVIYNLFSGGTGAVYHELDAVYREYFPQRLDGQPRGSLQQHVLRTLTSIRCSKRFGEPRVRRVPWVESYTTDRYLRLLETFSDHRALPEGIREQLFVRVRDVLERYGGAIDRPLQATLFVSAALPPEDPPCVAA